LTGFVDDISTDNMGNVYAIRCGQYEKNLVIAAHMDEIGFIVTNIEDNGFIRFTTLGGFDPKTLTSQRVIVHGKRDVIGVMGAKPIHNMSQEERDAKPKLTDYYIDLCLTKDEVKEIVEIGNPITRERELIELGNCVNGKSLDNRISVYALIETMKQLKDIDLPYNTYAIFTTQEEVGLRGAQVATLKIKPYIAIALDTNSANDMPGGSSVNSCTMKLGEGPAIKVMDASAICNKDLVNFMKNIALNNDIKVQIEVSTGGGTDTSSLQKFVAGGSIAGAISIPTRYLHQVIETSHKQDILGAIKLLIKCIKNINKI
jgi:endoglucanase